jgi:hypothetical protein
MEWPTNHQSNADPRIFRHETHTRSRSARATSRRPSRGAGSQQQRPPVQRHGRPALQSPRRISRRGPSRMRSMARRRRGISRRRGMTRARSSSTKSIAPAASESHSRARFSNQGPPPRLNARSRPLAETSDATPYDWCMSAFGYARVNAPTESAATLKCLDRGGDPPLGFEAHSRRWCSARTARHTKPQTRPQSRKPPHPSRVPTARKSASSNLGLRTNEGGRRKSNSTPAQSRHPPNKLRRPNQPSPTKSNPSRRAPRSHHFWKSPRDRDCAIGWNCGRFQRLGIFLEWFEL